MAIRGTRRRVVTPKARLTPIAFIDSTTRHAFITAQARKRFSGSVYRRQALLTDRRGYSALREALWAVKGAHPFTIDAFVLLPDHLHW